MAFLPQSGTPFLFDESSCLKLVIYGGLKDYDGSARNFQLSCKWGRVAERLISELTSYHASGEGWQSGKCRDSAYTNLASPPLFVHLQCQSLN